MELDLRADLIRRLLEYQKYKQVAEELANRSVLGRDVFTRGSNPEALEGPDSAGIGRNLQVARGIPAHPGSCQHGSGSPKSNSNGCPLPIESINSLTGFD